MAKSLMDRNAVIGVSTGILSQRHPRLETDYLPPLKKAFGAIGFLIIVDKWPAKDLNVQLFQDGQGVSRQIIADTKFSRNEDDYPDINKAIYISYHMNDEVQLAVSLPTMGSPGENKNENIACTIITFGVDSVSTPINEDLIYWNCTELDIS